MQNKMILTLGLTLLTTAAAFLGNSGANWEIRVLQEFQQWKQLHNKFYTAAEEQYRFQIFTENLAFILEHNAAQQYTFELGLNQFADLTNEEFEAQYLTLVPQLHENIQQIEYVSFVDASNSMDGRQITVDLNSVEWKQTIANSIDLTTSLVDTADQIDENSTQFDLGSVNWQSSSSVTVPDAVEWTQSLKIVVKNQGSCGSCWAFSGIGALEAAYTQAGSNIYLSEQELVDCAHEAGFFSDGCNGGGIEDVFAYSEKYGVASEAAYPYTAVGGKCDQTKTPRYKSKSQIDVESRNAQAFINAIAIRPVSVAINAGGLWFQLYKKGIYNRSCPGEVLNHAVLTTGYDNTQKFYNIKNSWGNTWGEAGYIRLAYIQAPEYQCGLQIVPKYPVV